MMRLVLFLTVVSITTFSLQAEQVPTIEAIQHLVEPYGVPLLDERLLDVMPISAPVTQLRAASVRILTRVPALELSLIRLRGSWRPVVVNKNLNTSWKSVIEKAIQEITLPPQADAMEVACELTRVLVDPDTRYGIVLNGRGSVPLNYESSAVLHHLLKEERPTEEISRRLLRKLRVQIAPPAFSHKNTKVRLVFFTWHYFGGEVSRWTIDFHPRASVRKRVVASQVGSFDYYY